MNVQSGYSINRLRLWGLLIGMGFALGIGFTFLTSEGNQLLDWNALAALGFGLCAASLMGLWLELKKAKR